VIEGKKKATVFEVKGTAPADDGMREEDANERRSQRTNGRNAARD
jgi:hypothetical protein